MVCACVWWQGWGGKNRPPAPTTHPPENASTPHHACCFVCAAPPRDTHTPARTRTRTHLSQVRACARACGVCARVVFAAEAWLNRNRYLIAAAFRGISAEQEVNDQRLFLEREGSGAHTILHTYIHTHTHTHKHVCVCVRACVCSGVLRHSTPPPPHHHPLNTHTHRKHTNEKHTIINLLDWCCMCAFFCRCCCCCFYWHIFKHCHVDAVSHVPCRERQRARAHAHKSNTHFCARARGTLSFYTPVYVRHTPKHTHTIEIWLILPVVICLFQGLSHACLRITALQESAHGSLHQT